MRLQPTGWFKVFAIYDTGEELLLGWYRSLELAIQAAAALVAEHKDGKRPGTAGLRIERDFKPPADRPRPA